MIHLSNNTFKKINISVRVILTAFWIDELVSKETGLPRRWGRETLKFNLVWNKLTKHEMSVSLDIRLCLKCQFCYIFMEEILLLSTCLKPYDIFASCISTWYLISKLLGDCFPHQTNNSWLFFSNLQNTIAGSHNVKV